MPKTVWKLIQSFSLAVASFFFFEDYLFKGVWSVEKTTIVISSILAVISYYALKSESQ